MQGDASGTIKLIDRRLDVTVEIVRIDPSDAAVIESYASVPMQLMVESVLEVSDTDGDWPGFSISERQVEKPWLKDYASDPDGDPIHFLRQFVCAHNAAHFIAMSGDEVVGAAAGIRHCRDAPYFCMTDGRDDIAVLADIRVTEDSQRAGVGAALFNSVAGWARSDGMKMLKIETQNTNVPACRFYKRMGARFGGVQRHAYDGANESESMLLWYFDL